MTQQISLAVAILVSALGAPLLAGAQGLEALGNRASALGAFVAVADDASAVAWNPSGLIGGPIFNVSIDLGKSTTIRSAAEALDRAGRTHTTLVAIGTTPLGLAYYRLSTTTAAESPAVTESGDRQDRQVVVRMLKTTHVGATVQQSVGDFLTLGATLKLVRGRVSAGVGRVSSWREALDRTDDLDTDASTTGDVDVGAMLAAGHFRAGLVVRNLSAPTFGDEDDGGVAATLDRHARTGVAWGNEWPAISSVIVAVDADLTRVPHHGGDRRDIAAGVERWVRGQRIGMRGGLRGSTIGATRPVISGGASYAVRAGTYVDAYAMGGRGGARGWGIAARMSF